MPAPVHHIRSDIYEVRRPNFSEDALGDEVVSSWLNIGDERNVMSGLDIFAWIVLIVLVLSTAAVVVFLAMMPGMIARRRNHPWAQAITVAGWVTLFLGFALWPIILIWAYVDVPRVESAENAQ